MPAFPEPRARSFLRVLFALLAGLLFGGLVVVLLLPVSFPDSPAGPAAAHLSARSTANPVTAVLLDFRGYDTLLELHVLLLAVLGAWSLGTRAAPREVLPVNEILLTLIRVLTPLLVLTAGYLVWLGAKTPGGAFQGGALLAGSGVLLALADRRPIEAGPNWLLRVGLALGPAFFLAVGLGAMAAGRPFLQSLPEKAPWLLLLIESLAAISIGLALTALFAGGRPPAAAVPKDPFLKP